MWITGWQAQFEAVRNKRNDRALGPAREVVRLGCNDVDLAAIRDGSGCG